MRCPTPIPQLSGWPDRVDVAIVGAGAAGIAAARRCRAAGLAVLVLEARARVGGRAVTADIGGHPIDLGAHWLHAGALNPLVRLGWERGERLRRAPRDGALVIEGRFASRSERRLHAEAFEIADRAFSRAARQPVDRSIAAAMPGLGRWSGSIAATMALISGRPLTEVSAADFPSDEFGDNYFIAGGYGAYIARLARGLPVALGTPATRIDWSGGEVVVATPRGEVRARAVVVTVPMPVLAAGRITFAPALPAAIAEAVAGFLPGTYEHVVLNWPEAPFRGRDTLTKVVGREGSHGLLSFMDDAPFHYLELDHETAARFDGRGPDALARFAHGFLRRQFGAARTRRLRCVAVTNWRHDPWSLCSWAVVPPGAVGIRRAFDRPLGERVWFAGEAKSQAMWGTVGGAWEEGERTADEIVARLRPAAEFRPDARPDVPSRSETT